MRKRLLAVLSVLVFLSGVGLSYLEKGLEKRYNSSDDAALNSMLERFPFAQDDASIGWQREGRFINLSLLERQGPDHLFDDVTYAPDDSGRSRVLLVGDSFIYGTGVANVDDTLGERLEDALNVHVGRVAFDVRSIGLQGASTVEQAEWLTDEFLNTYNPDLIVVGYGPNDVVPSGRERVLCGAQLYCNKQVTSAQGPEYVACLTGQVGLFSNLVRLFVRPLFPLVANSVLTRYCDLDRIAAKTNTYSHHELETKPQNGPYWQYYLDAVDRFAQINKNTPVMFAPLLPGESNPDYSFPGKDALVRNGLAVADTTRLLDFATREGVGNKLWANPVDAHPNRYLNELFAKDIVNSLAKVHPRIFGAGGAAAGPGAVKREPLVVGHLPYSKRTLKTNDLSARAILAPSTPPKVITNLRDGRATSSQLAPCAVLGRPHGLLYMNSGERLGDRFVARLHSIEDTIAPVDVYAMSVDNASKITVRKVGELGIGGEVEFTLKLDERTVIFAPRSSAKCDDITTELTIPTMDVEISYA